MPSKDWRFPRLTRKKDKRSIRNNEEPDKGFPYYLHLPRKSIHQPGCHQRTHSHVQHQFKKITNAFFSSFSCDQRKNGGNTKGRNQYANVVIHCFLPTAISKTSTIISMFKRPAINKNVLPYSYP
mgnify:CR=1 FL=1